MALPEFAGWQTESLRMTFFAREPVTAINKNWWQVATGTSPEAMITRPNSFEHSEAGPFGRGRLEMKVSFNRVDWLYTPVITPGPIVPSLGDADEILDSLIEPLEKWLAAEETSYVRHAFGTTLLYPVPNVADANRAILAYLPFIQCDPETTRDLFFQINFPINSETVEGLAINRLGKFMCATAQIVNIDAGQPVPMIQSAYYCRAELDYNTDFEWTLSIPRDRRVELMKELVVKSRMTMGAGVQP